MIEQAIATISATAWSGWLRGTFWVIPATQSLHILLVALLFGAAVLAAVRLLGPVPRTVDAARLLRMVWIALPGLALTGAVLILAEPQRQLGNPAFSLKLGLLLAVLLLSLALHRRLRAGGRAGGLALRLGAAASLLLWTGIAVAGRWIAYLGDG